MAGKLGARSPPTSEGWATSRESDPERTLRNDSFRLWEHAASQQTTRGVLSSQLWDWGLLDSESEDPGLIPAPLLKYRGGLR